jgi:UDPglucose 6-dehydrogenase
MPEFLTEKNWKHDFQTRRKWILGVDDEQSGVVEKVQKLLSLSCQAGKIAGDEIILTSTAEAEMGKYVRNCFLATKVSFFNEIQTYCRENKINYEQVRELTIMDDRISKSHTEVPGANGKYGFGGTCFPKDLKAAIAFFKKKNVKSPIMNAVSNRNQFDRE